ncbi:MAG: TIGR01458 family HAD-type hydrolase [Rhodospirillales bacterium]|nr:TIGR01458 family HAD-type hydrolase [Rhodospirillales bacterium]
MVIRAVLLDLEGVLYQENAPIPGALDAVRALDARGLGLRYVTNTTTTSRAGVAGRLAGVGLDVDPAALFTPLAAARGLLARWGARRIHLAAPPETVADFAGLELADTGPVDAVVMGDLYKAYDWDKLDFLFGLVREGARLIALHKNRFCRRGDAIGLDAGPFVAAVEYAAGVAAVVVGKPSAEFFKLALDDLGVAPAEAVMVGDDIEADIGGAQAAGLRAVQVETGKYTPADRDHPRVTPDLRIASIADLPAALEGLG